MGLIIDMTTGEQKWIPDGQIASDGDWRNTDGSSADILQSSKRPSAQPSQPTTPSSAGATQAQTHQVSIPVNRPSVRLGLIVLSAAMAASYSGLLGKDVQFEVREAVSPVVNWIENRVEPAGSVHHATSPQPGGSFHRFHYKQHNAPKP